MVFKIKHILFIFLSSYILSATPQALNCNVLREQKEVDLKQIVGRWHAIEIGIDVGTKTKVNEISCVMADVLDVAPCDNQNVGYELSFHIEFFGWKTLYYTLTTPNENEPGFVMVTPMEPTDAMFGLNFRIMHANNETMFGILCYLDREFNQYSASYMAMFSRTNEPIPSDVRKAYHDILYEYYETLPYFEDADYC